MTVRAKFKVESVTKFEGNSAKAVLRAVTSGSKENETFFRYTPTASIELQTINPEAAAQFEPGKEMYVDFTPVT